MYYADCRLQLKKLGLSQFGIELVDAGALLRGITVAAITPLICLDIEDLQAHLRLIVLQLQER